MGNAALTRGGDGKNKDLQTPFLVNRPIMLYIFNIDDVPQGTEILRLS